MWDYNNTTPFDRVESEVLRRMSSTSPIGCFPSLDSRLSVAPLSMFYRYFYAGCSSELPKCMPRPLSRPRCAKVSTNAHSYTLPGPYAGVQQ